MAVSFWKTHCLMSPHFQSSEYTKAFFLCLKVYMTDFNDSEDFPDSLGSDLPHSQTTSKSAEEEKAQIPKKVGNVELYSLLV